MRKLAILFALVLFSMPVMTACGMGKVEEKIEGAKDFTLKDLSGNDVTLSEKKGKIVVLNFWATWCPPCREEMPSMEKLHKKYYGKDFEIIAVAMDPKGKKIVKPYIDENGYTFTILLDDKGAISDMYRAYAVPMTFILARDGRVIEKIMGAADWFSEESQAYIEELIKNGAPNGSGKS